MNRKLFKRTFLPLILTAVLASFTGAYAANLVAKTGSSSLGKIVVNGKGMTAYFFDRDKPHSGHSVCTGGCATIWPPITSNSLKPTVSGISGGVGVISISGNRHQVTIGGRPIYTYAFDKSPGQINGEGIQGVWYVISPAGKEIKTHKATATPTPKKSTSRY